MLGFGTRLFGSAQFFWQALREIDPSEVKAELEQPFLISVVGREGSGRKTLVRALFGSEPARHTGQDVMIADVAAGAAGAVARPDLVLLVLDATQPDWSDERRTAHDSGLAGCAAFLVLTHVDRLPVPGQAMQAVRSQFASHPRELISAVDPRDEAATRMRLVQPILVTVPALRLALAHRFPLLRRAVAEDVIRETSRANAQFALMSSLPAMIPILGSIAGGLADLLVLTKNQAMLVFKLAGIYGRNIDDRMGIIREIAPVVGGAFVWRTLARTAVGAFPPILSALPKAAIAFAGTYVVGEAARYYYEHGERPPREAIRVFGQRALQRYREVNDGLKGRPATSA